MNPPQVNKVAIIGVGLIGGSFGMALRKRGLANEIVGIGRHPDRLQHAVDLGAIDGWSADLAQGVRDADLVYVSTPVGMELEFIRQVAFLAKEGCVITDAGSTKKEISTGANSYVREGISFIGGHPMAGSELTGVEAASPDLFVDAAYILTPTECTPSNAVSTLRSLAEGIGSRVYVMDPDAHDRCAAVISHLPHLIAAAMVTLAKRQSEKDPQIFELIAGSFRDMTRVAGSSPVLWRDICMTNAREIELAADFFKEFLDDGLKTLSSKKPEAFEEWFGSAAHVRNSLFPHK